VAGMEGIDRIKERIIQEAQEKKQEILRMAQSEAEEILTNCRQKAEEVRQQAIEKAKKVAEDEKRKILSMAELEQRKNFLAAKQQMIDEVFNQAQKNLENMQPDSYKKLLKKMLIKSSLKGNELVITSKKDAAVFTPEFLKEVNSELTKMGKEGNIKLSKQTQPMIGGFILKSKDMEINATFDSLIKIQREYIETQIAKILFEE
jgi:V/A-type H+-transporting ATPase subunit E